MIAMVKIRLKVRITISLFYKPINPAFQMFKNSYFTGNFLTAVLFDLLRLTELETNGTKLAWISQKVVYIEPEMCKNSIASCAYLKLIGYCSLNFFVMRERCPLACRFCAPPQKTEIKRPPKCEDEKWQCPVWAHNGDCIRFPHYMKKYCKLSCLLCGKDKDDEVQFDKDTLCPTWGSVGYCNENEEVKTKCKHSCDVYQDKNGEGLDPDYENAFYHYPFYIYYPYTTLKEPLATVPPTAHPPSEKPITPTLPPKYSTLAPTPAFTTPEPGKGLPPKPQPTGKSQPPKDSSSQPGGGVAGGSAGGTGMLPQKWPVTGKFPHQSSSPPPTFYENAQASS
ncbi:Hypothetical predicted protein [Paramuricea clavata]|uniref:Uncharacterized protein n=1 Tax=Paramuricea clavata TaxID=317549 RepID=A0A7D9DJR5_PARCT|nr:Hypothetical predicted protein [Paramuricea clavata]